MLFSNAKISNLVRLGFVAAWESVRPVPIAEIDFGNGRKITRTLNGNIATYLCAPDGRVLDVIPGLNSPESYLASLVDALNLYQALVSQGPAFEKALLDYHQVNLKTPSRYVPEISRRKDSSKSRIEAPLRYALRPAQRADEQGMLPAGADRKSEEAAVLELDTRINREERMPLIHQLLSEKVVRPAEITRRLYREVLHCDLDDPYLGLISKAFGGGAYEDR